MTGEKFKGLEEYMEKTPNKINQVKTDSGIKASQVIAKDTERRKDAIGVKERKETDTVPPPISELNANEITDRHNVNNASLVSGKEAILQHIIKHWEDCDCRSHPPA